MSLEYISVVIIARDAAETIGETLESVRAFGQVIVYDNGSTDGTQDVARRFENVRLVEGPFKGFGPTKNLAAGLADHDWIFSLDADEAVSEQLLVSIRGAELSDARVAFEICRLNYFMGLPVERGGWERDWLVRLYHRGSHQLSEAMVHENVDVHPDSRVIRLQGVIEHQAVREIGQFLQKIDLYTELRRESSTRTYPTGVIMVRAMWAFFRSYVIKLGFLAGWRGLVIAVSNFNGVFYKYMKIYADKAVREEKSVG